MKRSFPLGAILVIALMSGLFASDLELVRYNNPGLTVDLGVGLWAWPLPMDYDGDGDLDLVVGSGGKPYNGVYFFENPDGSLMPVFKAGVRVADYKNNLQISPDGSVLSPGRSYPDFLQSGLDEPVDLPLKTDDVHRTSGSMRANQWKYVDYDGDGVLDLTFGIGDWTDYGWDDAYNIQGEWTNGPLHGYVYWAHNKGTNDKPSYAKPRKVFAGGKPVDVYGMPSPNFADFDGDNDLDLICGEFLDRFTYFENIGSRKKPVYATGRRLEHDGRSIAMDLQMITPTAVDWDRDGDPDLIVGDEDGRVAFVENLGDASFLPPRYFRQEAEYVKFGALVTPVSFDWDGDGDEDLVAGNTAGHVGFIENLGEHHGRPRWARPIYLKADGEIIRIQAGSNGSIQGPCEAKWGYTAVSVADWDGDGLADIVVNSIWGKVIWFQNIGRRGRPKLASAQSVKTTSPRKPSWVWWTPEPQELVTQWRTNPAVFDWDHNSRADLIMLDHEGYLALFRRIENDLTGTGERVFKTEGPSSFDRRGNPLDLISNALRLNTDRAGMSGRRKFAIVDWDGDGALDLIVNSACVDWFRNIEGIYRYEGPLCETQLGGHTTSPTTVDWNGDGIRDLLIGTEDGFLYYREGR